MHVWNVLHATCWKYRTQNIAKNRHLGTIAQLCPAISSQLRPKAYIGNRKNLVKQQYLLHMSPQCAELRPTNGWDLLANLGHPSKFQPVSWLRYCTDVAQRRSTKLCMMFGRFLDWYTIYTFSGALAPWRNFARCKVHFKSCVLLYWQHYCTALEQWPSAKLCGVVQGMEVRNFCRGRHLYSAGRPSRWASAHILVRYFNFSVLQLWRIQL